MYSPEEFRDYILNDACRLCMQSMFCKFSRAPANKVTKIVNELVIFLDN